MKAAAFALVVILLVSPVAVASWRGFGEQEPNSAHDRAENWMFKDANAADVNRVYFQGFASNVPTDTNLNVALLQAGTRSPIDNLPIAYLGVWEDCNGDGYIGWGEQGVSTYRSELLLGSTLCAPRTVPHPTPMDWMPVHNDGTTVREFLPIVWSKWDSVTGDHDIWNINDNASRVWGDKLLPEAYAGDNGICWIDPPVGSLRNVGGMLYWLDCLDNYQVTDAFDSLAEGAGLADYSFGDAPRQQDESASKANLADPWGEPSDASYADAWDCSQPQLSVNGENTVLHTSVNASMPSTSPNARPSGSPSGTVNGTLAGFDECHRSQSGDRFGRENTLGTRHPSEAAAEGPYLLEAPIQNTVATGKVEVTEAFQAKSEPTQAPHTLASTLEWADHFYGDAWLADKSWGGEQDLVRGDDALGSPLGYLTYYAYVSPAAVSKYALELPSGSAVGLYGAESCGSHTSDIFNGWDCDPTHWYKDADDNDNEPRSTYLGPAPGIATAARPGAPYNLRDVDCYDDSVGPLRDLGVSSGTISGTAC